MRLLKPGKNMNEAFMRGYYEAYNSEDPDRLGAFLADDVVLISAQGEQHGKAAYLKTYSGIIADFRDQMTPTEIMVGGDGATVKITDRFTARHDVADFLGQSFKAGGGFTLKLEGRYRVMDGKIARIEVVILGME
jgi:ketosteroid isomerase-like protein